MFDMLRTEKSNRAYNLGAAIFAFLLWGGWSFYINTQHGSLKNGLISGLGQGVFSFVMTLFIVYLIEKQFHYFNHDYAKMLLPLILTVCISASLLVLMHFILGTPSILYTLFPVIIIAFLFALITNTKLYLRYKAV